MTTCGWTGGSGIAETHKVDVVRISDGEVLRGGVHPAVAGTLAAAWNRTFFKHGPYCDVRPAKARAALAAARGEG